MKILIVDDAQVDRTILLRTLQKAGAKEEIVQAEDGQTALEILAKDHKDIGLIFLDWQMPKIDGLEVLKRLARNPDTVHLPVVMLTSAISEESEEIARLLNPKLVAFLLKPLDPSKITPMIAPYIK